MQKLVIQQPDDWHVHFRDDCVLQHTVTSTAQHFKRALVMPNLKPPLHSLSLLLAYRERVLSVLPADTSFMPLFTFYLNDQVSGDELIASRRYPFIVGAKLYPAGVTTHSEAGVYSLKKLYPLLDLMQEGNQVLQVHGESRQGDIFEREARFITEEFQPLVKNFPRLRVVFEHISTKAAVDYVKESPPTVGATITPHHLLYNRNHLLAGGIKPHYYCLPILKHESDQRALQEAAISGNIKFFAGTDSAPHAQNSKENACGCAGIYSAPFAVAWYAELFDKLDQLSRLNSFLSVFGANFYQLPVNQNLLTLIKKEQIITKRLPLGNDYVIPMGAGSTLAWSIDECV